MKQKLQYQCEKCGHLGIKKITIWKRIRHYFFVVFLTIFCIFAFIGIIAIYNEFTGLYGNENSMVSLGSVWGVFQSFKSNFASAEDTIYYLSYTEPITKKCDSDECIAESIYDYLSWFEYDEEDSDTFDPKEILERRKGDCDQMSITYMALLKANGINSRMVCNYNHCWNIVYLKEKKILADLTKSRWEEY